MTSESYAREEQWTPLPARLRKWEASSVATTAALHQTFKERNPLSEVRKNNTDLNSETAEHQSVPQDQRPAAPRLEASHMWGVREDWGPNAKLWGKGAEAHRKRSPNDIDNPSS